MSLTEQEVLSAPEKIIIDVTCSFPHTSRTQRWPPHASIRMDVRRIVKPDLVADARFMPFREGIFDEIYCDPPHIFRKYNPESEAKIKHERLASGRLSPGMFHRYSYWTSLDQWQNFVKMTNDEFARTLKPKGVLFYKLTDGKGKGLTHFTDLKSYWRFIHVQTKEKSASVFKNRVIYLTFLPARIELENGGTTAF